MQFGKVSLFASLLFVLIPAAVSMAFLFIIACCSGRTLASNLQNSSSQSSSSKLYNWNA